MIFQLRNNAVTLEILIHYPEFTEFSECEGRDVDFYMACMYNLRRSREDWHG